MSSSFKIKCLLNKYYIIIVDERMRFDVIMSYLNWFAWYIFINDIKYNLLSCIYLIYLILILNQTWKLSFLYVSIKGYRFDVLSIEKMPFLIRRHKIRFGVQVKWISKPLKCNSHIQSALIEFKMHIKKNEIDEDINGLCKIQRGTISSHV